MASLTVGVVVFWGCFTVRRLALVSIVGSSVVWDCFLGLGARNCGLGSFSHRREGLSFVADGVKSVG